MKANEFHPGPRQAPPLRSRAGPAAASLAARDGAALGVAQARANAGPHATSLAQLKAVVAQRGCADCDRVKETLGGQPPVQRRERTPLPARGAGGPVQRVKKNVAVVEEMKGIFAGTVPFPRSAVTGHGLWKALKRKAFEGKQAEVLGIVDGWPEERLASFDSWDDAANAALMEWNGRQADRLRTPEEQLRRKRTFASLLSGGGEGGRTEEDLEDDERTAYNDALPDFLDEASQSTDMFRGMDEHEWDEHVPLPVRRRKRHKSGHTELPGDGVTYRTFTGGISPLPNAFVLGKLEPDYGPLLEKLVESIRVETAGEARPLTDRDLAGLFVRELDGENAFEDFSPALQARAHKVIAIMFFAEQSRHSIALLTAAAAFHAVASRGKAKRPGLVESFRTGSDAMRPLFAGTGGPNLMRGKMPAGDAEREAAETRRVRAALDLANYFRAEGAEGETQPEFIRRRVREMVLNVARHTGGVSSHLRGVHAAFGEAGDPLATLIHLGFVRHPMGGDENDCAIRTLYDQLRHHGQPVGGFKGFRDHVRVQPGVEDMGSMIDILNSGPALLAAVQSYYTDVLRLDAAPGLVIDVWAATGEGGLMEYQDVAQAPGDPRLVLTFYFNGVNHFDSLTGGPARI